MTYYVMYVLSSYDIIELCNYLPILQLWLFCRVFCLVFFSYLYYIFYNGIDMIKPCVNETFYIVLFMLDVLSSSCKLIDFVADVMLYTATRNRVHAKCVVNTRTIIHFTSACILTHVHNRQDLKFDNAHAIILFFSWISYAQTELIRLGKKNVYKIN